jgi:3-hydroxyacyl-CoA dehydrogenase
MNTSEFERLTLTEVSKLTVQDGIGVLEINSPPVNALGYAVRAALERGINETSANPDAKALIILCAGRTFFAGADISELGQPSIRPGLDDVFALIESSPKPVIAAIHGTALGGGFELALACHYRIAVPSAKVGLPEVALGLLPGAGGTQRTPRIAGLAAALELIVFGKPISTATAKDAGLIDEIATEGALREGAAAYARKLIEDKAPLRRVRDMEPDVKGAAADKMFADFRAKNTASFKGFKAPENIVRAIEAALTLPFDEGLRRESELFDELMESTESAAQRYIFFAERAASKIPDLPAGTKPLPISTVAVIGAGTMGSGIATAFLNVGMPVTLLDRDDAALKCGVDNVKRNMHSAVSKGRISAKEGSRREALLETSLDMSAVCDSDLIIEAVFENLDLKKKIFEQIDALAKDSAVLASNTSFLDLNAIAASTRRPASVVGMHFFSPANIMRLLEVVRGKATANPIVATAMDLGRKLGKVSVLSGMCDGFIANRAMNVRVQAAERLMLESVMPWEVDRVLVGYGFPMGVFAMLDLVGLDVIGWDRENSAGRTVQEELCEKGRWGQKRGGGYYDYDDKRRAKPSQEVETIIRDFGKRTNTPQKQYSDQEILRQLLYPVVNEGAKLLEEGIALRASDIDIALVTGYGWPVYTGGPMFWGEHVGLKNVVAALEADPHTRDMVSPLLRQLAHAGAGFASAGRPNAA